MTFPVHVYAAENLALCGAEVGDPCPTCAVLHRRRLAPRELEVLVALADGKGAKQAAQALGMSYQTLKNHLTTIYTKLGVSGLVSAYAAMGWIRHDR